MLRGILKHVRVLRPSMKVPPITLLLRSMSSVAVNDVISSPAAPNPAPSSKGKKAKTGAKAGGSEGSASSELFNGSPHPNYELWVGLETHAQIASNTKLFSGASTSFLAAPNSRAAFFDAALPGTLPRLNRKCVEQTVRTGLALGGTISPVSRFDRKHYYYCDMPLGFQITQQDAPLVRGGSLSLDNALSPGSGPRTVGIQRVQLEQDSGKNVHDVAPGRSYVDLNRAGCALMEIVTEPDIRSAEEAAVYMKKLQSLLRHIGASKANMEDGSLRCDVNVTVRRIQPPGKMTQRVEIKNLNSINRIIRAINHEASRQIALLEKGETVERETRSFNVKTGETVRLRAKENLLDYRFMPEPDLPPLRLSTSEVKALEAALPELPDALYDRFVRLFGLSQYDANVLVSEVGAAQYYQELVSFDPVMSTTALNPKVCANWLTNELFGRLKKLRENKNASSASDVAMSTSPSPSSTPASSSGGLLVDSPVGSDRLAALVQLVTEGSISGKQGKEILDAMVFEGAAESPHSIAKKRNMVLDSSPERLGALCDTILQLYPGEVALYMQEGRPQFFGFLVGQAIKLSKQQVGADGKPLGDANPKEVSRILKERLDSTQGSTQGATQGSTQT